MNVVEFIKTRARMCKNLSCGHCPLKFFCSSSFFDQVEIAEDAASVVEQWAKEHPVKTRQSEFLKMFPNAQKSLNGVLDICPRKFEPKKYKSATPDKVCVNGNADDECHCDECCCDFWLKEIE